MSRKVFGVLTCKNSDTMPKEVAGRRREEASASA